MLKISDDRFPVQPEPLDHKQNRPIKKPKLKPDPNLENLVTDDGHIKSGTTLPLTVKKEASASKRSTRRDNIPSTRNSAGLGGETDRVMRFDEEVNQPTQQSEAGDKDSRRTASYKENTQKNYQDPSEVQDTQVTA